MAGFYAFYPPAAGTGGSGTVTSITAGSGLSGGTITTSGTIALASIANDTVLGNVSGVSAVPSALSQTQLTSLINDFSSSLSGAAPASGGGTTNFLRADGTWAAPPGNGGATGSYWAGFHDTNQFWVTTSNTFVDPTPLGNNILTQRQASGITVTTAASTLPGIVFTPASSSAVYLVTAIICMADTSADAAGVRLIDGNGTILCQVGFTYQATDMQPIVSLSGVYAPGSGSAQTVKIQLLSNGSGTVEIGTPATAVPTNPIEWTLVRIA